MKLSPRLNANGSTKTTLSAEDEVWPSLSESRRALACLL